MLDSFDPEMRRTRARLQNRSGHLRSLLVSVRASGFSEFPGRLRSMLQARKLRARSRANPEKLTVILDVAGEIVATAFEQGLRTAKEDPQIRLLIHRSGHSLHEILVPEAWRQLPWHELHASVRRHPSILAERAAQQPDVPAVANSTFHEALEPRELRDEQCLGPIEVQRPLVVVPGILGSDLWSRTPTGSQGAQLWPPYTAGRGMPELAKISKLDAAVPKVAVAGAIFHGVYGELLGALRNMGYEDNPRPGSPRTLWVFPYDWTKSCDDAGKELANFIADTVLPSRNPAWETVDIVNHSMGGIVTRAAQQLHGAPIFRSAYVASPHNGSANAFLALHPALGVPFFDRSLDLVLSRILNSSHPLASLQQQVMKWQSTYDLLPDERYESGDSDLHDRFPAVMRAEVLRAQSFKARLSSEPMEKHIIFSCSVTEKNQIGRKSLRAILPALRFLRANRDVEEDSPRIAATSADGCSTAVNVVSVPGAHLWIPSMPVVHAGLRKFLASC